MSEFKGTPGPWHTSIPTLVGKWAGFNTAQGRCFGVYATNDDLEAIAMVYKDDMLIHSVQDHKANANLIASAPELLTALTAAVKMLKLEGWSDKDGLIISINNTIAKALGKEIESHV